MSFWKRNKNPSEIDRVWQTWLIPVSKSTSICHRPNATWGFLASWKLHFAENVSWLIIWQLLETCLSVGKSLKTLKETLKFCLQFFPLLTSPEVKFKSQSSVVCNYKNQKIGPFRYFVRLRWAANMMISLILVWQCRSV